MGLTRRIWGLVFGLPGIILGVLLVALPAYTSYLLLVLVIIWVTCVILGLLLQNRELRLKLERLRQESIQQSPSLWRLVEDIVLLVNDNRPKSTQGSRLAAGDTIRVSATLESGNPFVLCLARVEGNSYESVERLSETTRVVRQFNIEKDATYAVMVERMSLWSHVRVRIEKEEKPGVMAFDW